MRRRRQGGPPAVGHHADLVGAIKLVPRQVEQEHHVGTGRRQHPGKVDLVHLEHGSLGPPVGHQGRHVSGRHVRPGLVADHVVTVGAERDGQQPGRCGLAVRPADQSHAPARRQSPQELRVDLEAGPTAGHRALAPAETTRRGVDRARRGEREAIPHCSVTKEAWCAPIRRPSAGDALSILRGASRKWPT